MKSAKTKTKLANADDLCKALKDCKSLRNGVNTFLNDAYYVKYKKGNDYLKVVSMHAQIWNDTNINSITDKNSEMMNYSIKSTNINNTNNQRKEREESPGVGEWNDNLLSGRVDFRDELMQVNNGGGFSETADVIGKTVGKITSGVTVVAGFEE